MALFIKTDQEQEMQKGIMHEHDHFIHMRNFKEDTIFSIERIVHDLR